MTELKRTYNCSLTYLKFWNAIRIWITKPHVLNKRLSGAVDAYQGNAMATSLLWETIQRQLINDFDPKVLQDNLSIEDYLNKILNIKKSSELHTIEVYIHKLIPKKQVATNVYQLSVLDFHNNQAIFATLMENCAVTQKYFCHFPYAVQLCKDEINLKSIVADGDKASWMWLCDTVLPQIIKWAQSECQTQNNICQGSLNSMSLDKYYTKYNELKLKYGKDMVARWTECTDPAKFVYEDVAIATYLLLLWEEQRIEKEITQLQKFVDLGCGNGLLVYILSEEGHQGIGIDVRRRDIWDTYPKSVILKEETIIPSAEYLFPEADWIIGNHSDELTPWIPVIAARSSYSCNFFLLPCCFYDFNGSKYQRRNSSKSQYLEYLDYIKEICQLVGINTTTDRLKIPSTKRICIIGRNRLYESSKLSEYSTKIQLYLNERCGILCKDTVQSESSTWLTDFKPRSGIEKVKNCTQLDKGLIHDIVKLIADELLKEINSMGKPNNWYDGQEIELGQLASVVPPKMLKQLKAECGGLQTLLKNNHHIFSVQSGRVKFRYPRSVSELLSDKSIILRKNKNKKVLSLKQRLCWFFNNHPQGCPLADENCSFLHKNK